MMFNCVCNCVFVLSLATLNLVLKAALQQLWGVYMACPYPDMQFKILDPVFKLNMFIYCTRIVSANLIFGKDMIIFSFDKLNIKNIYPP